MTLHFTLQNFDKLGGVSETWGGGYVRANALTKFRTKHEVTYMCIILDKR